MDRIMVNGPLSEQLAAFAQPVAVVDENGRRLGHFVPALAMTTSDDCPYSAEQLQRMRREEGGRPLPEIWRSLGAK